MQLGFAVDQVARAERSGRVGAHGRVDGIAQRVLDFAFAGSGAEIVAETVVHLAANAADDGYVSHIPEKARREAAGVFLQREVDRTVGFAQFLDRAVVRITIEEAAVARAVGEVAEAVQLVAVIEFDAGIEEHPGGFRVRLSPGLHHISVADVGHGSIGYETGIGSIVEPGCGIAVPANAPD